MASSESVGRFQLTGAVRAYNSTSRRRVE